MDNLGIIPAEQRVSWGGSIKQPERFVNGVQVLSEYCSNHGRSVDDRDHEVHPQLNGMAELKCVDCGRVTTMDWQVYTTGKRRPPRPPVAWNKRGL